MMSKSDEISMASLRRGVVSEVGTQDPVKDFMTLLGRDSDFVDTAKQLHKVIFKLVKESFGDVIYPKALDCVRTFRQQSIKVRIINMLGLAYECHICYCSTNSQMFLTLF